MPSPFFWQGLTRGVSQGFQAGKAHKERKEKLELERRKLKLEEDVAAQKIEQLKRVMTGQESLDTLAGELETGAFGAPDERVEQLGGPPDPEALQPGEERQPPKPSLRDRLLGAQLRQGKVPDEFFKSQNQRPMSVGVGGTVYDPASGQEIYRNPNQREGVGNESRIFSNALRNNGGDVNAAIKAVQDYQRGSAEVRGAGGEAGRMGVRGTPEFQRAERAVSTAKREGQIQGGQNMPLSPGDAGTLGVPYGTTGAEARGATALTSAARNTLTNMASAESVLTKMEEYLTSSKASIPMPQGAMERATQTPGRFLSGVTQSDPAVVTYHSLAKGMLASFSRSVGGERGQTTEQDVARAEALIPKVYPVPDTKDVAVGKLKQLRALIEEIKTRTRTSASGVPQPGGAPQKLEILEIRPKGQ